MATINQACDYTILMCTDGGEKLNLLKLQKLLYYVQAWHLAFYNKPLFDGKFQAWIHGPVNRQIYDRFAETKTLYSEIGREDMTEGFDPEQIPKEERLHIDSVLEVYAPYTGSELEAQAHVEEPWVQARKGFRPTQRSEAVLDEGLMATYYGSRVE